LQQILATPLIKSETHSDDKTVDASTEPIADNRTRDVSVAANCRLEEIHPRVTPRRVAESEEAERIYSNTWVNSFSTPLLSIAQMPYGKKWWLTKVKNVFGYGSTMV